MGRALDELLVLGHQLVLDPVERHWHMAAAVDVTIKGAAVVDDETFLLTFALAEKDFFVWPGWSSPTRATAISGASGISPACQSAGRIQRFRRRGTLCMRAWVWLPVVPAANVLVLHL